MNYLEKLKKSRGMSFLEKGMRVQVYNGKYGKIINANASANLKIKLDGSGNVGFYHPCWNIKYFNAQNEIIAEYKE